MNPAHERQLAHAVLDSIERATPNLRRPSRAGDVIRIGCGWCAVIAVTLSILAAAAR